MSTSHSEHDPLRAYRNFEKRMLRHRRRSTRGARAHQLSQSKSMMMMMTDRVEVTMESISSVLSRTNQREWAKDVELEMEPVDEYEGETLVAYPCKIDFTRTPVCESDVLSSCGASSSLSMHTSISKILRRYTI